MKKIVLRSGIAIAALFLFIGVTAEVKMDSNLPTVAAEIPDVSMHELQSCNKCSLYYCKCGGTLSKTLRKVEGNKMLYDCKCMKCGHKFSRWEKYMD